MHDLDRTYQEFESTSDLNPGELEMEFWQGEAAPRQAVFDEMDEMELAANLLEVGSDEEMEQFLGDLISNAARAILPGPVNHIINLVKGMGRGAGPARSAAPAGRGVCAPGPGLGRKVTSAAKREMEMELEGMSPQDQEFEAARRIVRLAGEAAKNAAQMPPTVPPAQAARSALISAANRVAPALAGVIAQSAAATPAAGLGAGNGRAALLGTGGVAGAQTGRWVRRGNRILLLGV